MIDLRECQDLGFRMCQDSYRSKHRAPILVASTGFGKTRVAAAVSKAAVGKGNRVVMLTPRRGLTLQAEEDFYDLGLDTGVLMAGIIYDSRHPINVASFDTVLSRMKNPDLVTNSSLAIESADLVIVDECHLAVSPERRQFLNDCMDGKYGKPKRILGLTASPCKYGGGGLGDVFDDLIIPITMEELIKQGLLVQPHYYAAEKPDLSGLKLSNGDYKEKDLAQAYDGKIMGDVISNWRRIAPGTPTVVFTPTRANAADVVARFNSIGVRAEYLDAHTKDRERQAIYNRVESGETTVIANVGIVSLGVDIPCLQTVVMATATKSVAKWMQAVGRGTRLYPGKDHFNVIDHGGMTLDPELGPVEYITEWTLDPKSTINKRQVQAKQQRKEPKDISCSKCKTVFRGRLDCPKCGFKITHRDKIEYHQADLKRVKPDKLNRDVDWRTKVNFMGQLKQYAKEHGKSDGWCAHTYKDLFGVWPNDPRVRNAAFATVTEKTRKWVKHKMIKYAKSQKR